MATKQTPKISHGQTIGQLVLDIANEFGGDDQEQVQAITNILYGLAYDAINEAGGAWLAERRMLEDKYDLEMYDQRYQKPCGT